MLTWWLQGIGFLGIHQISATSHGFGRDSVYIHNYRGRFPIHCQWFLCSALGKMRINLVWLFLIFWNDWGGVKLWNHCWWFIRPGMYEPLKTWDKLPSQLPTSTGERRIQPSTASPRYIMTMREIPITAKDFNVLCWTCGSFGRFDLAWFVPTQMRYKSRLLSVIHSW